MSPMARWMTFSLSTSCSLISSTLLDASSARRSRSCTRANWLSRSASKSVTFFDRARTIWRDFSEARAARWSWAVYRFVGEDGEPVKRRFCVVIA